MSAREKRVKTRAFTRFSPSYLLPVGHKCRVINRRGHLHLLSAPPSRALPQSHRLRFRRISPTVSHADDWVCSPCVPTHVRLPAPRRLRSRVALGLCALALEVRGSCTASSLLVLLIVSPVVCWSRVGNLVDRDLKQLSQAQSMRQFRSGFRSLPSLDGAWGHLDRVRLNAD